MPTPWVKPQPRVIAPAGLPDSICTSPLIIMLMNAAPGLRTMYMASTWLMSKTPQMLEPIGPKAAWKAW